MAGRDGQTNRGELPGSDSCGVGKSRDLWEVDAHGKPTGPAIRYRTTIYTNTKMSSPFPTLSSSKKRKRPLNGSQDDEEWLGGPDREDLEIRPPGAPPLHVRSDGQDLNTTRNALF